MREKIRSIFGLDENPGIQDAAYEAGVVPSEMEGGNDRVRSTSLSRHPRERTMPPSFASRVTDPADIFAGDIVTRCATCRSAWVTRTAADADELAAIHRDRVGHSCGVRIEGTLLLADEVWSVSCPDCGLMWISLTASPADFAATHRLHTGHSVEPPERLSIDAATAVPIREVTAPPESAAGSRVVGVRELDPAGETDGAGENPSGGETAPLGRWCDGGTELNIPTSDAVFGDPGELRDG